MRVQEMYLRGKKRLLEAGCESAAFDAGKLLELLSGWDRTAQLIHGEEICPSEWHDRYHALIERRASGEPLQYLIKKWDFMGHSFFVGPGVLIPREETELLVREAITFCEKKRCRILDLCAGSGAIAISCACALPCCSVTAIEWSDSAMRYLCKNCAAILPCDNRVQRMQADVLAPATVQSIANIDVMLSNPPYIPTADLSHLQREVQYEPAMALDGGTDGLDFYRAILQLWYPKLNPGGLLAVECGIGQCNILADWFEQSGLRNVQVIPDFNGIGRVVRGIRPK